MAKQTTQQATTIQKGSDAGVAGNGTNGGASTALARTIKLEQFQAMQLTRDTQGDVGAAMLENLGGAQISGFDLDRIRVPAGGALNWEIVDVATGETDASKEIEGVIVWWQDQKAYWAKSLSDGAPKGPPQCFSLDTVKGIGDPGVLCAGCKFNVFGSGRGGKAKACKDVRMLAIVREQDIIPMLIPIPPTSLKGVKRYFLSLAGRGIPFYKALSKFTLTRDKNSGGVEYAKVNVSLVGVIDSEVSGTMKRYKESVAKMLGKANVVPRSDDVTVDDNPNGDGGDTMEGAVVDGAESQGAGNAGVDRASEV